MRYLYDKHKRDLPKGAVNPKHVKHSSSSEEDQMESDNPEREVKFI